jgi:hypothetical protein
MKEQIQQRIIENLQHLNSFQLSDALDFIEFLRCKGKNILPLSEMKEANYSAKRQDISLLPKRRLGKIGSSLSREDIYENER